MTTGANMLPLVPRKDIPDDHEVTLKWDFNVVWAGIHLVGHLTDMGIPAKISRHREATATKPTSVIVEVQCRSEQIEKVNFGVMLTYRWIEAHAELE